MNLDEAQKRKVVGWIEEGLKVSEIQTRLATELGLRMTYMELRFLLDDLRLKPKDREQPAPAPSPALQPDVAPPKAQPDTSAAPGPAGLPAEPLIGGKVSVSVDQVARPGALVSGKVTFSDGQGADWNLDQFGRLGLAPAQPGYKPSQQDIMAFQAELQNELAKMGL